MNPSPAGHPWSPEVLARVAAHCEADAEREVCGFVVARDGALAVVQVPNVADRYHAKDPLRFPRTSRHAYLMDPRAQLRLHEELEAGGGAIVGVWHSHVEVGAYFSAKDQADAVVDGRPVVPGAEYLVAGVAGGRVTELKRFVFVDGEYLEAPIDV